MGAACLSAIDAAGELGVSRRYVQPLAAARGRAERLAEYVLVTTSQRGRCERGGGTANGSRCRERGGVPFGSVPTIPRPNALQVRSSLYAQIRELASFRAHAISRFWPEE